MTFYFLSINKHNPQYALFGACTVRPESCHQRTMEKWKQMCVDGVGTRQEWRVQCEDDGEVRIVNLPHLVVAGEEGIWVDWREMFDVFFRLESEIRRRRVKEAE